MADYGIVLAWKAPRAGREMKALEVFAGAQEIYEKGVANGLIDSFETVLLQPTAGGLPGGYTVSWGTAEQIDTWARNDDYMRLQLRAGLVADGVAIARCIRGDAIAEGIGNYSQALGAAT
jgi:hypothetical protein